MQSDVSGKCYNVGRGIGTSIKELTETILELTGSRETIQYEPAGLTFVTNRIGCPKAAKEELGFQWQIDLRQGLRDVIDWRRQDQIGMAA